MNTVLIAADPIFERHAPYLGHPDQPHRLQVLADLPAVAGLPRLPPRPATDDELLAAHSEDYLSLLGRMEAAGGGNLCPDTPVGPESVAVARHAVGACIDLALALAQGEARAAVALVRPPGHHAERERGMGFCLLNNVAAAALAATRLGRRAAVLDWDVHHGNGTQNILWRSGETVVVSIHQYPHYPWRTGGADELGEGPGHGLNRNVPMPAGCRDGDYLRAFEDLVCPVLRGFAPDVLLISAGFDAHRLDPYGGMALTAAGFREMLRRAWLAVGAAPVLLVLEGGYSLDALRESVAACVDELARGPSDDGIAPAAHPDVVRHIERVKSEWDGAL